MIVVQKTSLLIFPILQFFPASLLFTCQVKVETEQKYWKLIESFKVKKINLGEEKSLSSRAPSICARLLEQKDLIQWKRKSELMFLRWLRSDPQISTECTISRSKKTKGTLEVNEKKGYQECFLRKNNQFRFP